MSIYLGSKALEEEKKRSQYYAKKGGEAFADQVGQTLDKRDKLNKLTSLFTKNLSPELQILFNTVSDVGGQEVYKIPENRRKSGFYDATVVEDIEGFEKDILGKQSDPFELLMENIADTGEKEGLDISLLRQGGKIPKYKKGGGFSFSNLLKSSDDNNEVMNMLNAILETPVRAKGEIKNPDYGSKVDRDHQIDSGKNIIRVIQKINTPEGERYYPGEGISRNPNLADKKAMMNALLRSQISPADSITTDQFEELQGLNALFPEKKGGGKIHSNKVPTIVEYFSNQGKTLSGSNIDSWAKKLGRI